jgi:hypothetical protein
MYRFTLDGGQIGGTRSRADSGWNIEVRPLNGQSLRREMRNAKCRSAERSLSGTVIPRNRQQIVNDIIMQMKKVEHRTPTTMGVVTELRYPSSTLDVPVIVL